MGGNVGEWCRDWHQASYIGAPVDGAEREFPAGSYRVLRGGSSSSAAAKCRSAARDKAAPSARLLNAGFRVAAAQPMFTPTPTPRISPTPAPPTPTPTPIRAPTPGPDGITLYLPGDVPLVLVPIPPGSFRMGSPFDERSRQMNEGPQHTVVIDYEFYMGKCEVTQAQWLAVMKGWPDQAPISGYGLGDNYPAYFMQWGRIVGPGGFIEKLNEHVVATGQAPGNVRLPSEAEWEYACRAGTETRFFFGDSLADSEETDAPAGTLPGNRSDYMWFWASAGRGGSREVGLKLPNQFGLYDMSGNVFEWCQDTYHDTYAGAPRDGSAWETQSPHPIAVIRGGDWDGPASDCRSAARWIGYASTPGLTGFRVVFAP